MFRSSACHRVVTNGAFIRFAAGTVRPCAAPDQTIRPGTAPFTCPSNAPRTPRPIRLPRYADRGADAPAHQTATGDYGRCAACNVVRVKRPAEDDLHSPRRSERASAARFHSAPTTIEKCGPEKSYPSFSGQNSKTRFAKGRPLSIRHFALRRRWGSLQAHRFRRAEFLLPIGFATKSRECFSTLFHFRTF